MIFHQRAAIAVLLGVGALSLSVGGPGRWQVDGFIPAANAEGALRNMLTWLRGEKLPPGIVETNGRLEATQINVSAKYPGRLEQVSVEEGSDVTQGQVVAKISSPEYEAQLRAAQADLQRSNEALKTAEAEIIVRQSSLDYAKTDLARSTELVKSGAVSQQALEKSRRNYEAAEASVRGVTAQRDQARSSIRNAQAQVERIQSILNDLVMASPRPGRVQYQLARTGEVVPAGAPIVTILDLTDVYMTIFVPGADATKLEIGSEARIVLDAVPDYVIPATVSFVAADAQFTPKTVETKDERTKLMFRVKLKIDPLVLQRYYTKVKTGVRGIGVVRTDSTAAWPADLQVKLPAAK